jgi:hypothetical protein
LAFDGVSPDNALREAIMELGAFSVSLAVKEIEASKLYFNPASFMIVDPDGNTILVDRHV